MEPLVLLGRALLVFVLLGVVLVALRRSDGLKRLRRTETPLEVLGSARLGKGASIALVRIGDADYALGVTDQAVSLLTEAELPVAGGGTGGDAPPLPEVLAGGVPAPDRPSFAAALQAQVGLLARGRRATEQARQTGPVAAAGPEAQVEAGSQAEAALDSAPAAPGASTALLGAAASPSALPPEDGPRAVTVEAAAPRRGEGDGPRTGARRRSTRTADTTSARPARTGTGSRRAPDVPAGAPATGRRHTERRGAPVAPVRPSSPSAEPTAA